MPVDLRNLSIAELKRIKRHNQQELKKEYSQYKKKQKLIDDIKKIEKVREKLNPTPTPNPNPIPNSYPPKSKNLRSIFRSVSKIKQYHPILLLIFAKLLNELLKIMIKEL